MDLLSRQLDKENSHSFIHVVMVIFDTYFQTENEKQF